jgi:hypothetical protein
MNKNMSNKANFQKSQMFITTTIITNCNEKTKLDTWSKRTQTKPILPASAGKIALSAVEGPIKTAIRQKRIQHKDVYNRSIHEGFLVSIRATFFSRRQCFNCLSRAIAEFLSEKVSKYNRLWMPYFFEKCGTEPCLCSYILRLRLLVKPTYKVPLSLEMM